MAKTKAKRPANNKTQANQLRIIGGQWRSRKLPVASVQGLRPTPDRVRETLFNWLQMTVPGARCLDLFAGSGALGFEALSREAREVVMVEKHPIAFAQLKANVTTLNIQNIQLLNTDALLFLKGGKGEPDPFDVIFLDPPFRKDFVNEVMCLIRERGLLKADGKVYLEYEMEFAPDFTAWGMVVLRETKAGQVVSVLLENSTSSDLL